MSGQSSRLLAHRCPTGPLLHQGYVVPWHLRYYDPIRQSHAHPTPHRYDLRVRPCERETFPALGHQPFSSCHHQHAGAYTNSSCPFLHWCTLAFAHFREARLAQYPAIRFTRGSLSTPIGCSSPTARGFASPPVESDLAAPRTFAWAFVDQDRSSSTPRLATQPNRTTAAAGLAPAWSMPLRAAPKIGSITIFAAACTTRSRTVGTLVS